MNFKTSMILIVTFCTLAISGTYPHASLAEETASAKTSVNNNTADLSGIWILDAKESDDLKQIMASSRAGRKGGGRNLDSGGAGGRPGGGGGRRGGGGGGGGGGGMNQEPSSSDQKRMQKNMKDLQKEIARLEIFQTGNEFNVTDGLDMTRLIFTDGRDNTIWTRNGEAHATAEWLGQTLKIEIRGNDKKQGQVRHYSLSEDGTKLTVLFKKAMGPSSELKTIRLVYRQ